MKEFSETTKDRLLLIYPSGILMAAWLGILLSHYWEGLFYDNVTTRSVKGDVVACAPIQDEEVAIKKLILRDTTLGDRYDVDNPTYGLVDKSVCFYLFDEN